MKQNSWEKSVCERERERERETEKERQRNEERGEGQREQKGKEIDRSQHPTDAGGTRGLASLPPLFSTLLAALLLQH